MIINRENYKCVIISPGDADRNVIAAVDYRSCAQSADGRSCYRSAGGVIGLGGNVCNIIFIQSVLREVSVLVSITVVYTG